MMLTMTMYIRVYSEIGCTRYSGSDGDFMADRPMRVGYIPTIPNREQTALCTSWGASYSFATGCKATAARMGMNRLGWGVKGTGHENNLG